MATFVFLNLPARGHINPTLPIVSELATRGHEVHYFTAEEYRRIVESAGAKFHLLAALQRIRTADVSSSEPPGDKQIAMMPFVMAHQSTKVVPELVETIQALKPNCLVYNVLSLWGRLIGQILDVPAVAFRPFHGPRMHRSVMAPFASDRLARLAAAADRELEQLAQSFGRIPRTLHELISDTEDLTLIFMPREFQAEGQSFDQRFLFVGPSLIETPPERWPFEKADDSNPLRVYVSLGTLRNNDPEFYRRCFLAFDSSEWQVAMSVGAQIDLAALTPIPENFHVERFVKQAALLKNVDVFVTHGGLNSTMESLYLGVPMVVVPGIGEQRLTAGRVQELGLGVVLQQETLTAEILATTTRKVALNPDIRTRLRAMQSLTRMAGGFKLAAEAIIDFASNTSSALNSNAEQQRRPY
jgi:MGT family glycosyltransferase